MQKRVLLLSMLVMLGTSAFCQQSREEWVDSVMNALSVDQKIGQLLMIRSANNTNDYDKAKSGVRSNYLGGVLYTERNFTQQSSISNDLQRQSAVPPFVAMDASLMYRSALDSSLQFPIMRAQGAVRNDSLLRRLGRETARQMKLAGINMTLVSANTFSQTNADAYADNVERLAEKANAFHRGLQEGNLFTCASNFPLISAGVDNPVKNALPFALAMDSVASIPFRRLLNDGLKSMMINPNHLPQFNVTKKSTLANLVAGNSANTGFVAEWMKTRINFNGLLVIDVDRLNAAGKFASGEAEVFAFRSGHELLITSSNISPVIRRFKKFLKQEKGSNKQLDQAVRKILSAKYEAGLQHKKLVNTEFIRANLFTSKGRILQEQLYQAAITVVSNDQNLLPITQLEDKIFKVVVADDSTTAQPFLNRLRKYIPFSVVFMHGSDSLPELNEALRNPSSVIVVTLPGSTPETLDNILPKIKFEYRQNDILICDFGSPAFEPYAHEFPTVVTAYSSELPMLESVPQALFGAIPANGTLPVSMGRVASGTGRETQYLDRLSYSFPSAVGIDEASLAKIDAIAQEAIAIQGTPGCHVLVAKAGKIVYEKSFGHLTYEKQVAVNDETVYDLASVTKVAATLQSVMFLHDRGLIDINKKASVYLPELQNSNKKDATLKDILTHQAGLWPFLPFWAQTMKDTTYLPQFYSRKLSADYPFVVSDRLFASASMKDSLWSWIIKSKVREKPARTPYDYKYSDMGFYILHHLSEKMLNQPMEDFLGQNLYEPLGAHRLGYTPLLRFPISQIAPTENDKLFRRALLIGTVHDQGAAMHGGIAGHAGLFGTATDLAKLGQMLLQGGKYGGIRFYKEETVKLFTARQFETSRRGLGWDKPTPGDWNGPTSYYASPTTFGHTGFTGTCIWVDPEFDLVYIFLSNRVHPDMTNNKLLTANIRSRIQDAIYQAIFNFRKYQEEEQKDEKEPLLTMQALGRSK